MSYPECCDYFRKKCLEWNSIHPHYDMRKHINQKGKSGLVSEFRNDLLFNNVICPFLKHYAQGKEKDVTSSMIEEATSLLKGELFSTEIDLVVVAVLEACGYEGDAIKLLKIILGAIVVAGAVAVVLSALKRK